MRRLRVLHVTHPDCLPPETDEGYSYKEIMRWKTDFDVVKALRELGHEVRSLGVDDELRPVRDMLDDYEPHIVFNLLEQFAGLPEMDQHVVSYLELRRVAYTGCNPRGLTLARDKSLAKKLVHYHRILTPAFLVFPRRRKVRIPAKLGYPAIVKSATEEASMGISQASVVEDEASLVERIGFIHDQIGTDAMVEEYIDGRELYVGVLGNQRKTVLPVWELGFGKLGKGASAPIATEKVKHDATYQKKMGITHGVAKELAVRTVKRICRILEVDGYARIDFRMTADGRLYFLEANPNPEVAWEEELAASAELAGIEYPDLIRRIVNFGLARKRLI